MQVFFGSNFWLMNKYFNFEAVVIFDDYKICMSLKWHCALS